MAKIKTCPTCAKDFGLFRWRYNCVKCNNIFCNDCLIKENGYKLCRRTCHKDFKKNINNWVNGTKYEYIRDYSIIKDFGLIEVDEECNSPADVEILLQTQSAILGGNSYVKFFWDKHTEHHSEEYKAGTSSKGNAYYKTRNYTTKHFTGHAIAVLVQKKTKKVSENTSYEKIIECSQKLEKFLEKNLNAKGKGLHEKVSSVEDELSKNDISSFRLIATLRNTIIHEGKTVENLNKFETACNQIKLKFNLK